MKKETKELLNSEFTRNIIANFGEPFWFAMNDLRRSGVCIVNKIWIDLFYKVCTEILDIPLCGGAIVFDEKTGEMTGRCFYVD